MPVSPAAMATVPGSTAERGVARFAAVLVGTFTGKQVDDAMTVGAAPDPQAARLGMFGLAMVAKILVHGRHAFAQLQSQPVMKIIVGRNPLHDGECVAQQNVSAQLMDHDLLLKTSYFLLRRFAAMRILSAFNLMKPAASFWS